MKVTHIREQGWIKLYVDGYLHCQFKWIDLIGIHSWNEEGTDFFIRLTLKNSEILLNYDEKVKWLSVLETINQL